MSFFFAKFVYGNHRLAMGYCRFFFESLTLGQSGRTDDCRLSFYHLIVSSPIRCPIPKGMAFLSACIAQPCYGWLPLSDAYGIILIPIVCIFDLSLEPASTRQSWLRRALRPSSKHGSALAYTQFSLFLIFFESLNLWIFDCTLSTICKIYIKE